MTDFYFTGDFFQIFFRRISFTRRFFFFLSGRFFCTDLFLLSGDDIFSWVFSPGEWFFRRFLFTRKFSFLLFNSRIFFFQDTLFAFQEILLFIFFLYFRRFFFFHEIFFLFRIFFSEYRSPGKKKKNLQKNKTKQKKRYIKEITNTRDNQKII